MEKQEKSKKTKKSINIMTSCDDNLMDYIFVQIRTMAMHLIDKEINFYFFHNRVDSQKLEKLRIYAECFSNIKFHEIFIEDIEPYYELAKHGGGNLHKETDLRLWPYEAYFSFECYKYLPKEVDRILYIDAGDVVFAGEIDEFYFDDFEDKILLVAPSFVKENWSYFTSRDLSDKEYLNKIKVGVFNSGSYMINVDAMRKEDISIDKVKDIINVIIEVVEGATKYFGDQGLLSIVFINKMKYFNHDIKDLGYKPYNFTLTYFRADVPGGDGRELWYEPKIIHLVDGTPKPWNLVRDLQQRGLLEHEGTMSLREVLDIAVNTKNGAIRFRDGKKYERTIIEPGMIPFFEYWFNVNELVKKDFEKIFK